MVFTTPFVLFAALATAITVTAIPADYCPPGVTETITVTLHETATIVPVPTGGLPHTPPAPTWHPTVPHTPLPTPSHSSPPSGGSGGGGSGYGGSNSGGSGSGGGGGNGGSNGNGGSDLNLCCDAAGEADSLVITELAQLISLDVSNETGLIGLTCILIGEGYLGQCSGSLIKCGSLSGLGVGSNCSV